ncbi:hypothetical protein E1B28_004003 [Marasmius oreades]|uniref:Uncharacterized protein n=1 Tax=Marasmius oreades TaxID=181124 RepID=A0A9P8AC86_9AGAR|nr:uncharacterized protein E1B28_004003 [Marasmius oreades]KAG7096584.1 hypothetical protein E1B28_004003 [Marasmius oreades]
MENESQYDQQVEIEATRRFQSFKLGKPAPPTLMTTTSSNATKHQHRRSHSRNASVVSFKPHDNSTTPSSLPTHHSTPSLSSTSSTHTSLPSSTSLPLHNLNGSISGKRNSHHRRRSSVSTRTESAEIMGFQLPDLPKSSPNGYSSGSDDDKDSIRRRALWALEGKNSQAVIGFQKVEIPDMSVMDSIGVDRPLEFPSKPSFPAGSSHRDSFKIKPSSSAKDQLHTLVEEEEEEEEDPPRSPARSYAVKYTPPLMNLVRTRTVSSPSPVTSPTYAEKVKVNQQPLEARRPRPLSLKPLSLTPESISLPTPPTISPSPAPPVKGLKVLSLTSSPAVENAGPQAHTALARGRPVLHINPEVVTSYAHVAASSTSSIASAWSEDKEKDKPVRRSSISYKSSTNAHGLPTPDQTPTWSERRFSTSSSVSTSTSEDQEGFFRDSSHTSHTSQSSGYVLDKHSSSPSWANHPLSASEQHFLFKSHNALLVRIQDLERTLSVRVRREREMESRRDSLSPSPHIQTRPLSTGSDITSFSDEGLSDAVSDELLNMIRDLKAERDELKRDVDGWRQRVGEGEKTIGLLSKRVECERREAWVARGRVGVMTQEKEILEKQVETERQEKDELFTKVENLEEENGRTLKKLEDRENRLKDVEEECAALKQQIEQVQQERDEEIRRLQEELLLARNSPRVLASTSVSHASRTTYSLPSSEVDDEGDVPMDAFEDSGENDTEADEADEEGEDEDQEDGLAGYEDEDPLDLEESVSTFSDDDTEDFAPARKVAPPFTPHAQIAAQQPLPTPPSSGLQAGWKFPSKPMDSPVTPSQPTGNRRGHRAARSLSTPWTFPKADAPSSTATITPATEDDEVDRFFGCFDDSSSSASSPSTSLTTLDEPYDYERKDAFTSGLRSSGLGLSLGLGIDDESFEEEEDDEAFPFELRGVGVEVPVSSSVLSGPSATTSLDVVVEEDEEEHEVEIEEKEDEMMEMEMGEEIEIGGIKITFTPPRDEEDSPSSFYSGPGPEGTEHKESREEACMREILSEVVPSEPVLATPPPVSRTASIPVPILVFNEPDYSDEEEEEETEEELTFRVIAPSSSATTSTKSSNTCWSTTESTSTVHTTYASPKLTPVKASSIPIPRSSSFKFPSIQVTPPSLVRSVSTSSSFSSASSLSSSTSTLSSATPPTSASVLSRSPSPSRLPRLSSSPSDTFGSRASPSGFRSTSPSSFNAFITPPTKRGGVMSPSLIPQPSPSKRPTSPSRKADGFPIGHGATFIRQPKKQTGVTFTGNKCTSSSAEADDILFNPVLNDEEEAPATPRASSFSFSPPTLTSFKSLSSFMPSIPITSLWSIETPQKDKCTNVQSVEKKYVSKEAQLAKLRTQLKTQNSGAGSGVCGRCSPSGVSL